MSDTEKSIDRILESCESAVFARDVVHEHTSSPIGFDDSKAILRREIPS